MKTLYKLIHLFAFLIATLFISPAQAAIPSIAAGAQHSLALESNGSVVAWGNDSSGQLGIGRQLQSTTPQQVVGLNLGSGGNQSSLSAGSGHNLTLKADGRVWAWGFNKWYGQVGIGEGSDSSTALPVPGMDQITQVAAGHDHSLALKADGTVWSWGANSDGQLGDGTRSTRYTPIQVQGLTNIVAISAGGGHNLALDSIGSLWAWGNNSSGQIDDTTTNTHLLPVQISINTQVISISAGNSHSILVDSDGNVWAWGNNSFGQLGSTTTANISTPTKIPSLSGVVKVVTGASNHNLALKADGSIWSWGENGHGELGLGTQSTNPNPIPTKVTNLGTINEISTSVNHSVVLASDGTIWTWGDNSYGKLGNNSSISSYSPIQLTGLSDVVAVTSGWQHSLVLKSNGELWVWGSNASGQLGNAQPTTHTTPVSVANINNVTAVAAGWNHSLALKSDGTIQSWGLGGSGQLGDGNSVDQATAVAVSELSQVTKIAAGGMHSLAVRADGNLWIWGSNENGQLGNGTTVNSSTPIQVQSISQVVSIAAGYTYTIAVKSDGTVWSWGSNENGQLGDGTTTDHYTPIQVLGLDQIVAVAIGREHEGRGHTIALKSDGSVWTWGYNTYGQLGDGSDGQGNYRALPFQVPGLTGVVAVAAGFMHSIAIKSDGSVWTWGNNWYGQLGNQGAYSSPVQVQGIEQATSAVGGRYYSMAMKADGTLWSWGINGEGQLGTGVYERSESPQIVINKEVTGILDLNPSTTNSISSASLPSVILSANKEGGLSSLVLGAKVYIGEINSNSRANRTGNIYKVFVAAIIPSGTAIPQGVYILPSTGQWANYTGGAIPEYLSNISFAQAGHVDVYILDGVDLSGLNGSEILVGWGVSDEEMLSAQRYRSIFMVQ